MSKDDNHDERELPVSRPSKRERLRRLLFTAGTLGTTLAALGMLADTKLPRYQSE